MKILLIKTSSLGDIVHTFPVVSELKARLSHVQIDFVVEEPLKELVQTNPSIDHTLPIQSKEWRKFRSFTSLKSFIRRLRSIQYDVVFDLQGNSKSALITLFSRAKKKVGFGFQTVPEWPNLLSTNVRFNPPAGNNIRNDYLHFINAYFGWDCKFSLPSPKPGEIKNVMVSTGSAWKNKKVPMETLIRKLASFSSDVNFYYIWGNDAEKEEVTSLSSHFTSQSTVLPKYSLPELQKKMKEMDLVIAMDSLPLHLAADAGVATYGYFGPSSGKKYAPNSHYIQGKCPYGISFDKRCPYLRTCKTADCIRDKFPKS